MNAGFRLRHSEAVDPVRVERPLCIEAGEVQIDAMGSYCGTSGVLLSVRCNGINWYPKTLRIHLNPLARQQMGNWDRDLTRDEITAASNEDR